MSKLRGHSTIIAYTPAVIFFLAWVMEIVGIPRILFYFICTS